jgi:hypothetical protein
LPTYAYKARVTGSSSKIRHATGSIEQPMWVAYRSGWMSITLNYPAQ